MGMEPCRDESRSKALLMRIAYKTEKSNWSRRGLMILVILLLAAPFGMLHAEEPAGPVEVSAAIVESTSGSVMIDLATARPATVRSFTLTSPSRLVFDIEDAVLALGTDAETSWSGILDGLDNLEITQFSDDPPIVRVIAYVSDPSLLADRSMGTDGLKLAIFRGTSPFSQASGDSIPANLYPVIENFWHEPVESGGDHFTIDYSFGTVIPQIRIESPTLLLLRFPGTDITLPASSPTNFSVAIDEGNLVERMRAEKIMADGMPVTEIRLTVKNTATIGYTLETSGQDMIDFILFEEALPEIDPAPAPVPEVPDIPVAPAAPDIPDLEPGQIMVLSSGGQSQVPSDASINIERVQFQTIDNGTDRFYIFYGGGELSPRVQRFSYPTRITFYFSDTSVILPAGSEDRYDTPVDGALSGELKVFNRVIEDMGPECQFVFYFPELQQENIGFTMDYTDEGEMHIDFYSTNAPVMDATPVEVNMTIPDEPSEPDRIQDPAPAPEITEETVIEEEIIEEPAPATIDEMIEEMEAEIPEPVEVAPEEPLVLQQDSVSNQADNPGTPLAPGAPPFGTPEVAALPVINVSNGIVDGNRITFHIVSETQLGDPEIIEYRYPDRIGLRFPMADVNLFGAGIESYSEYSHIRSVPLARTITKDRDGEQFTTIAFTLDGSLEEYESSVNRTGTTYDLTFIYTPQPEIPEIVEEPVVTPEVIEEPVVMEEPAPEVIEPEIIEEPAPEPIAEPEIAVEPVQEETIDEPDIVQPAPESMDNDMTAPEPALPELIVTLLDSGDSGISFEIRSTDSVPLPEWVEYSYPDRIGLKFPLADVKLLNAEEGIYSTYTHVTSLPLLRAIQKDREDEQSTTIVWTLSGTHAEYDRNFDWSGNSVLVSFEYNPIIDTPDEIPQNIPDTPPTPPIVETSESTEVPVVIDEPDVINEEPGMIEEPVIEEQEPQVIEEPEYEFEEEIVEPEPVEEIAEETPEEHIYIAQADVDEQDDAPQASGPIEIQETELYAEPVGAVHVMEVQGDDSSRGDWYENFNGITIESFDFETDGNYDKLVLETSGELSDWEIMTVNYPTKIMVRIPNTRPIMPNGDPMRYNMQTDGNYVDQVSASATVTPDTAYTSFEIWARDVANTDMLEWNVDSSTGEWVLSIAEKGMGEMPQRNLQPEVDTPQRVSDDMPMNEEIIEPMPVGEELEDVTSMVQEEEDRGPMLNMRLEDADIQDVLQLIASEAGLNITIDEGVRGNITISLENIRLFDLLDLLGDQMEFTYILRNGVYVFGDPMDLQEKFKWFETWYIQLSYADPDQVRSILNALDILTADQVQIYRGNYSTTNVDIASPRVVITGDPRDLERAYRIIAALDQPPVMVQVDFKILSTSLSNSENFGFIFDFGTPQSGDNVIDLLYGETGSQDSFSPVPEGLRRGPAYALEYRINYLLDEGMAELMNASSLTVANNQAGTLFVGEEIPFRSTFQVSELGRTTQRIQNRNVGLQLQFTVHANPDNTVTIVLNPQNSSLLELTDIGPRTQNQRFTTTLRINDGEPFVIGGFIRDEQRVNYERFPLLSELPLLGQLFRNKEIQSIKSELIFMFTPHIIKPNTQLPIVRRDGQDYVIPMEDTILTGY